MKRRNFIFYLLLFTAGCAVRNNFSQNNYSHKFRGIVPQKIRFTVTEMKGLKELQQNYEIFRTALEDILRIDVDFFPVENFVAAAPALQSNQVDLVFAGPSEYVVLHSRAKPVPVIGVQRQNYYSVIAVHANSNIKSLSQLKGKKIAMGSKIGASGYLYPTKLLMDAGLDPKSDFESLFLGDKSVEALKNGDVDAWAFSISMYKQQLREKGLSTKEFPVIASGPNLPSDIFVASNQLAPSFIEQMQKLMLKHQDKLIQAILTSPANAKFKGSKMHVAVDADYNMIREVYKAIGQGDFIH
jgi:phosphonate transport system substrate-binding protein